MAAAFDTWKFAKMLQNHGSFTPEQAEALTYAFSDLLLNATASNNGVLRVGGRSGMANLVGKGDPNEFVKRQELAFLASKADLAHAKVETLKWVAVMFAIMLGIIEGAALAGLFR